MHGFQESMLRQLESQDWATEIQQHPERATSHFDDTPSVASTLLK